MTVSFYSCPNCNEEISGPMDTGESMFSQGFGAILKKECHVCKQPVGINWKSYYFSKAITLLFIGVIFGVCYLICLNVSESLKIPLGVALAGFSVLSMYILSFLLMPKLLGKMGVTLYKKGQKV